jgi:hypothetical protein
VPPQPADRGSAAHPRGPAARKFGMDQGKVEIPPEFFGPLPDDILRSFTGEAPLHNGYDQPGTASDPGVQSASSN